MTFPRGERECECGACRRGFTSLEAFDRHRQGFRCLEPSSVGLWLATDGLWSRRPRSATAEAAQRRVSALRMRRARGGDRGTPPGTPLPPR